MPQTIGCKILEEVLRRFGKNSYEHSRKMGHFRTLVAHKVRVGFDDTNALPKILNTNSTIPEATLEIKFQVSVSVSIAYQMTPKINVLLVETSRTTVDVTGSPNHRRSSDTLRDWETGSMQCGEH
jgi:hypothetical protein